MAIIGKVIAMTGVANIINEKGDKSALTPGAQIQTGDSIQTAAGVTVDVQLANGRVIHVGADQLVNFTSELAEVFAPTQAENAVDVATIDSVIDALENGGNVNAVLAANGNPNDPAGGTQEGHNAVYLERINELLNPLAFPQASIVNNVLELEQIQIIPPNIGAITPDTEDEGTSLVHTITINNAFGVTMTFPFSIVGITASPDDIGTPIFSSGVTLNAAGDTITVPGGVTSFTVTVPSLADNLIEGNETYQINVGTLSAIGTIVDTTQGPTIISVEPGAPGIGDDAVPEGTPLVYTTTLSEVTSSPVSYTFNLGGGTASAGDFGAPTFSNGVTLLNGVITVPAGVTSFTVTVPTIADGIVEGAVNETVPLTIGGVTGIGQIIDPIVPASPTITSVEPAGPGAGDDAVPEGTNLIYTVTLSGAPTVATTYEFVLGGGTASAGDFGAPIFSNGVTLLNGVITVPAGVTSFTVTVPTVQDLLVEDGPNETVPLIIGGVEGIGQIIDDDLIVTRVDSGSGELDPFSGVRAVGSAVIEGDVADPLHFTVTLNKAAVVATTVNLSFSDGTGTFGTDTTTPLQVSFDDGATFTPFTGTTVTVPVGASSFIVSVPTFADTLVEDDETILFTASTASNTVDNTPAPVAGTIIDDDLIVTRVDSGSGELDPFSGVRAVGSAVIEGDVADPLHFTVTLNKAAVVATAVNLSFSDGTGTFGTDTTTPLQVSFDDGATFTPFTGTTVTVPVGASSFIVSVPTFDDTILETDETILFTASTASNGVDGNPVAPTPVAGTIIDNDGIFVTRVDAGSGELDPFSGVRTLGSAVIEGDAADPLHYTVTLNQAAVVPTLVTLAFSNGTGTFGTDTTTPLQVSFDDGATFTPFTGTTVTVPVGASSFIVSVPTFDDTILETDETILFTASTASNGVDGNPAAPTPVAGTIIDNDVLPLATGLSGEYFGYNDGAAFNTGLFTPSNLRHHQDDQLTSTRDLQNLDSIADVETIINGRNGAGLVGTADKTNTGTADATFNATEISYGIRSGASIDTFSPLDLTVTNNLGSNVVQSAGETLDSTSALSIFLDKDGTTATVQAGAELAASPTGTGTSSGIGLTTDSVIRLTGSVFLPRGNYDFRVLADDGFRLKVGGETLIEFDGNQSPTVREYQNLNVDGLQAGLTPIELIYWEQGQNGVLRIEYKLSSEDTYQLFSLDNLAMFGENAGLSLDDNQALVNTGTPGNPIWEIQSGLKINGTDEAATLVGSALKDVIVGGAGDDTLNGLAGNDTLRGNGGVDTINGGDGSDVLDGGLGDDIMTGGRGDDVYYVDSVGDITFEAVGEGTDTIQLDALYGELNYTIGDNIENLNLNGSQTLTVTGNDLANRIIGNSSNNQIDGGAGNDRIIGGQGSDELTGGSGSDVFEWNLADKDGVGVPEDHITDFVFTGNGQVDPNPNNPGAVSRTDAIDLRDLLQGESSTLGDANFPDLINPGNLLSYLNFEVDGTGSTVISVSSNGGFAGGFDAGAVDQRIVLDNVNLFTATASGGDSTLLLKNLLANGSLIVD
jgi:Ca2+-binding RTX toxin-like protein